MMNRNTRTLKLVTGLLGVVAALTVSYWLAKRRPRRRDKLVDTSVLMFWPSLSPRWHDNVLLGDSRTTRRRYGIGKLEQWLHDVIDARFKAWVTKQEHKIRNSTD